MVPGAKAATPAAALEAKLLSPRLTREMDSYSAVFKKTIVHTVELQDPFILADYKAQGFNWIRPRYRASLDAALRNPIIGSFVELLVLEDVGCMYIDSPAAKRLIRRVCPGPL